MNILTLTNCPLDPYLGSGKSVIGHTQGLRDLGHCVDVVQPEDYEVWRRLKKGKQYRQAIGAWGCIKKKLKQKKYDLIEFYGGEFWFAVQKLSKIKNRPLLVAHTNGLELLERECQAVYDPSPTFFHRVLKDFHTRLIRKTFERTDVFVSLCELERKYVVDHKLYENDSTAVIPPGLDEEYVDTLFFSQKDERVAYMGGWLPRKGVKALACVMSRILKKYPKVSLDLYGTAVEPLTVLSDFPAELHHRIEVYPRLSNQQIVNGLEMVKVFFFPSEDEGFGIAIAEAMASSCAVVTTPTGFGDELKNGEEALICGFNEVDKMEESVEKLLQDEPLRLKVSQSGWKRVRALRWEESARQLESIYTQWVDKHQCLSKK